MTIECGSPIDCHKCQEPIPNSESATVFINDEKNKYFCHPKCLSCHECGSIPDEDTKIYKAKDDLFYCPKDYRLKFQPTTCHFCHDQMGHYDFGYTLAPNVYAHTQCFKCSICKMNLQKGQRFGVDEVTFQPFCENCQLSKCSETSEIAEETSETNTDIKEEDNAADDSEEDLKTKKRTPRTKFTEAQTQVMMQAFMVSPRPTRAKREDMAKQTGLPIRCIQIWFQNKRSKEKRNHLRNRMPTNPNMSWFQPYQTTPYASSGMSQTIINAPPPAQFFDPSRMTPPTPSPPMVDSLLSHGMCHQNQEYMQQPPSFDTALQQHQNYSPLTPPESMDLVTPFDHHHL